MANPTQNSQIVIERLPGIVGFPNQRFNVVIDPGVSFSLYLEDRADSDFNSKASAITATGLPLLASAPGSVTGSGTTNTLPKWTDGPDSVLGDSRITDDGTNVAISTLNFFAGADGVGNDTAINLDDGTESIVLQSGGNVRIGEVAGAGVRVVVNVTGNEIDLFSNVVGISGQIQTPISNTVPAYAFASHADSGFGLNGAATSLLQIINGTTVLSINSAGALSFVDNVRQVFNPGATVAGLNVGALAGDPSTPINGDLWYDSTGNLLRARINGATVSLAVASLVIGSTVITGGVAGRILYETAGNLLGEISGLTSNGSTTLVQTSNAAAAFVSGPNGATNPVFTIINNVASAATGISITGNVAGAGAVLSTTSSGADEALIISPKGSGSIIFNVAAPAFAFVGNHIILSANAPAAATQAAFTGVGGANPVTVSIDGTDNTLITHRALDYQIGGTDVALGRNAAGVAEINSTTSGTFRDLKLRTLIADALVRLKGYTVATLPVGTQGDTAFVTDALAPTFLATVVGGGAVVTPVFYNGTNWIGF